ncbi:MAG TPA: translocation/assembly module TamB domain-containing protein, partial [Flavobacterium sp.]|nr:translocation/assembly module TamB domain-containing protein [Flavobacterium sp.]
DLESTDDYTTGTKDTRTDLNVGITKRFFDDRLKVSVGSNFGLEGTERENEKNTNIAGNFEMEYMLSRDGRYLLKAYRKDEYQVALQGQVIETGVGFVITIDYNKFREIISRRKSSRTYKRNQRTIQNETVEE